MDELIAKLETAIVPDRELDAEICKAAWPDWERASRSNTGLHCPFYTASIDAALRLVPEDKPNRKYSATIWTGARPAARIFYRQLDINAEGGWAIGALNDWEVRGATPAIALCVACLMARNYKHNM